MRKNDKIKPSVISKLAKLGCFPIECTGNIPVVELKGPFEAHVSGCSKILEYNDCSVKFNGCGYLISICGEGLKLADFTANCVCVDGIISRVEVCKEK